MEEKYEVILKYPHIQFWCHIECVEKGINGMWGLNLETDAIMMGIKGEVYEEPQAEVYDALDDDDDKLEFIRYVLRNTTIDYAAKKKEVEHAKNNRAGATTH